MSISVMTIIWDRFPEGGSKLLTMLALADWGGDDGNRIFPSMEALAGKIHMSKRQAQRIVGELVDDGFLTLENPTETGRGQTRSYQIDLEFLARQPRQIGPKKRGSTSPEAAEKRVTSCHPSQNKRVTNPAERVTNGAVKGDTKTPESAPASQSDSYPLEPLEPLRAASQKTRSSPNESGWGPPDDNQAEILSQYLRTLRRNPRHDSDPALIAEIERSESELSQLGVKA